MMTFEVNVPALVDAVLQAAIALTSLLAMWIATRHGRAWSRWGFVVGLLGQPFWLYVHWHAGQFGMLLVAILFTMFWAHETWDHFPEIRRWRRT